MLFMVRNPVFVREWLVKSREFVVAAVISALLLSVVAGAFFVKSTQANPIMNVYNDIAPSEDAQPPVVTIHTPVNGSFYPNDVTLTFDVAVPKTTGDKASYAIPKVYYKASWETREIVVSGRSIDLSDVRGGNLSVTIYAVGVGLIQTGEDFREENGVVWSYNYYDRFEMTGYSTVSFVKDLVPPRLNALSPQNRTYATSDVNLDFTVNEATSEMLYCLDGKENQTATGNVTLTGLKNGAHNVTLYAADLAGNPATPQTVSFTVDSPQNYLILASIAATATVSVGLGVLLYFKKRGH
jgi:hypothetical protein